MLIILEGPDGAGKSTLARKLSDSSNLPILHFSYPKTESDKLKMFEDYAELIHITGDAIIDRCWYSEMVYGPLVRDGSAITPFQMNELERLVLGQGGGFVIHCTAPMSKLWQRFKMRGDEYIREDFELLYNVRLQYEKLLHSTPHLLPVVRYSINEKMQ